MMVNNIYMYDEETIKDALVNIEKSDFPIGQKVAIYGIVRNYFILTFGTDIGEGLSPEDMIYYINYSDRGGSK